MQIKTERLIIRELAADDAQDYFEIFGNPAISKYDDFSPIKEDEAAENIAEILEEYKNDSDEKEYGVELEAEKKITGVLYLHREGDYFFIGYHFNEKYHGRGLAFEAVTAFISYLENSTGREVRGIVDPENKPSIKLLIKLSFEFLEEKKKETPDGKIITELIFRRKRRSVL